MNSDVDYKSGKSIEAGNTEECSATKTADNDHELGALNVGKRTRLQDSHQQSFDADFKMQRLTSEKNVLVKGYTQVEPTRFSLEVLYLYNVDDNNSNNNNEATSTCGLNY
ncbi:hypothetical protein PV325_007123 [Microctonus aethiopoides]|nr:hypothetical protein PV325_007123 [Microctonus aethiopoides]